MGYIIVFAFGDKKGLYTYNIGDNWLILLAYIFFGVAIPFVLLYTYRGVKKLVVRLIGK